MKRLSLSELIARLDRHAGTVIVAMTTRTEPALLARSRANGSAREERWPHGIEKLAGGRFMLANCYERNVQDQRRREGHPRPEHFRAGRIWAGKGERLGRFLVRHVESGRLYVRARPASDEHGYPVRIWERWLDLATGRDVAGEELEHLKKNWLKDRPKIQPKQQLARQVPYRTYQVHSIHSVTFAGEVVGLREDLYPYKLELS